MTLIFFIFGLVLHSAPFVLFGIVYGWIYLRFIQKKGDTIGDLNDTFAFSSFFPEQLAYVKMNENRIK